MHEEKIDERFAARIDETVNAIHQRRMVLPAILFLVGHRPLAFTFGQFLLILQPLAALLGSDGLDSWARLLSHPGGPAALTERLSDLLEKDCQKDRGLKSET